MGKKLNDFAGVTSVMSVFCAHHAISPMISPA
jgi:hypothetical protein